jgi:hypothetical protein
MLAAEELMQVLTTSSFAFVYKSIPVTPLHEKYRTSVYSCHFLGVIVNEPFKSGRISG